MENPKNIARFSKSEKDGIKLATAKDQNIYSVGISTGGRAEVALARRASNSHVIATTLDTEGIQTTRGYITKLKLQNRITLTKEDVSEPLPYASDYFDYIYARLVLHYLPKDKLLSALSELRRVLKKQGQLYIVVRSNKCGQVAKSDTTYDPVTEFTDYSEVDHKGNHVQVKRHFFTKQELANYITNAGYKVMSVKQFDEKLFKDYGRTVGSDYRENLIEMLVTKP